MILKQLEMNGINIQYCCGQAFDNAAVIASHRAGIQARITEVNPEIVFVPCTNHSLNLAAAHASSVGADSVTYFGTLDRLCSFFSASTHPSVDILIEISGAIIKRAGETRWCSREDAVKVVYTKFTEIIAALEQLMEDAENATSRSIADLILQAMLSFSFMSSYGLWRDILPENKVPPNERFGVATVCQSTINLENFSTFWLKGQD
ncbi:52 kDa repressor of the inhibitor of the protein kinase-like [Octopus sinensis]|uniref:52 kDa repressor of the inhibitor of the protein kinase-like n=1 Tax=Octopus sinensis TaxID=2607531 RepID=A0A6P7S638_9MOLL|nr:52 kDa repressor of the inhibitor of the protein kinase-like [Octopus sinensis]